VEPSEESQRDWTVVRANGEPLKLDEGGRRTLPDGTVIAGKYVVHRVLGRGSGSTVYLGEQQPIGRQVAIKVLPLAPYGSEQHQRLVREAKLLAELTDESLVRVFDLGWLEVGTGAVVMELLEGETLREHLRRVGRIGIEELPKLADALDGLAAVHAHRVVHRDLTPGNLFLATKRGGTVVKIIDFGLGRALDDQQRLTALGRVLGSPAYLAPEQLRQSPDVDERADLYTFGVSLFEALCGRLPFIGAKHLLALQILREPAPRASTVRSDLTPALDDFLAKAMAKAPAERFQSAEEMAAALRDAIDA